GLTGRAVVDLKVRDPQNQTAPAVALDASLNRTPLSALTSILGTVTGVNLDSWVLEQAPLGSERFIVLARGSTLIAGGRLADIDPLSVANGFYRLRLTATDFDGQTSSTELGVEVNSASKLHAYQRSEADLTTDLGGVPVSLTRAYDSGLRDRSGAFGFG